MIKVDSDVNMVFNSNLSILCELILRIGCCAQSNVFSNHSGMTVSEVSVSGLKHLFTQTDWGSEEKYSR